MSFSDAGYPRDLVGYGRIPPQAKWPGGARIAVQFVINYEEGGENNILHGDAASEAFLSEVVGAAPWPGMRHMNMESVYEYGTRAGYWRLHRLFTERAMPVTVFAVATALARYPAIVPSMQEAGWEIATHGLKWIEYKDFGKSDEAAHIHEAVRLQTELTGARPLGLYQGRTSVNTIQIAMEEQGFLYCADSYADELPYWLEGPHGPQLVVPYTLDANDMRFATAQGFNSGDQFFAYLKDSFDMLYAEGTTHPKMLSIGLHCRLAGRPGRAAALARFLDYVKSRQNVWVATRLDIARHWIAHHPPPGGYRPSRMPRALFVERFGDIFEHTPQIAERAHGAGLDTAADTAEGLHAALMRVVEAMPEQEQVALIQAHPELAGREAVDGTLTAASAGEQGRLGLTSLSPPDFARITAANRRYREKFGFSCIVALARHETKEAVFAEMENSVLNDRASEIRRAIAQIGHIALSRIRARINAEG